MKKLLLLILLPFVSLTLQAIDLGGVTMPDTLSLTKDQTLKLNGAGIREKMFIDLYVGGLYLERKSKKIEKIIGPDVGMMIRLHITSDLITSKKMTKATLTGFEKSTGGQIALFQSEIEQFLGAFEEEINESDIFEIAYEPTQGMRISKNGQQTTSIKCNVAFKDAVFGIWLSDKPAQKSLKKAMLGLSK